MKRNLFSLSRYKLATHDLGELVPVGLWEVLPGDTIQHSAAALIRCSPLLTPVMHPVEARIHTWYVPTRLIWDEFDDMITAGPAGTSNPTHPTITYGGGTGAAISSLADYLGIPTGVNNLVASALPTRAYNLIWNENYRDQDLETAAAISTASGADATTSTALRSCAWEKDYLTSARPWEQKGPAITIPIGTTAPVLGIGIGDGTTTEAVGTLRQADGTLMTGGQVNAGSAWAETQINVKVNTGSAVGAGNPPQIFANLAGASAVTVNALRQALALQRYEENRARYGSRYVEYLRMLGVQSSDARLQRPEYLGGGRQTIQFSEVLTTGTFGAEPVGSLKGHGIGAFRSMRYRRFIEEHGYIISLLSLRPKTIYMQGLPRLFNRRAKEDYFQPELQHIGQQPVLRKEVYAGAASPDGVFGYQDRYDEYRRAESEISGEFRTTLNMWHFGRSFGSEPSLNGTFVSCIPPENAFAVNTTDTMWSEIKHSMQARRIVAKTGRSFIF